MPLPPELAERIRQRMRELSDPYERAIAAELGALPIAGDMGGYLAPRPDGEILSCAWQEPREPRAEPEARVRNAALFRGSRRYPELAALVPARPETARTCPHCEGTGEESYTREHGISNIVCYCGGLGWLPP